MLKAQLAQARKKLGSFTPFATKSVTATGAAKTFSRSACFSFLSLSPSAPSYLIHACQSNKIGWRNAATENVDDSDSDNDVDADTKEEDDDGVRANTNFLLQ